MPFNIGRVLSDFGLNIDDDALASSLRSWEQKVFEAARKHDPSITDSMKFSNKVPLNVLPAAEQANFVAEYRRMIGFDYALEHLGQQNQKSVPSRVLSSLKGEGFTDDRAGRLGRIWGSMRQMKGMGEGNTYGMFPELEGGNSLIDKIYRSMNVQFRPYLVQGMSGVKDIKSNMRFAGASNYFTFGRKSISTVDSMISSSYTDSLPDLSGKKLTVFDIETAGFARNQIREIAWKNYTSDANRVLTGSTKGQAVMRPGQFGRGQMILDGSPVRLEEYAARKYNIRMPVKARMDSGTDFVDQVRPFLKAIEDSDYLVGHNISNFDIEQVFTGLAGTKKYKRDKEFAEYVDNMYTKARSSTIDTLELVRSNKNLGGLGVAKILGPEGRAYSIENLLLKTNLAELIGFDKLEASGILELGLHSGDIDALVTTGILDNLDNLKKTDLMRYVRSAKHGDFAKKLQKVIAQSSALTPWTNITDLDAVDPSILARYGKTVTENGIPRQTIKISALEQEMLLQRNLAGLPSSPTSQPTARDMLKRTNIFDRVKNQGIVEAQRQLREMDMPFADLSIEERGIGTKIAKATSGKSTMAADALVSTFEGVPLGRMQLQARTGRATIPLQVLEDLGLLREGESILSLSTVEATEYSGKRSINVVLNMDKQKDVNKLVNRLEEMAKDRTVFTGVMGEGAVDAFDTFSEDVLTEGFLDKLRKGGLKQGVTIAQAYENRSAVSGIWSALQDFFITDDLKDEQTRRLGMVYAGRAEDGGVRTAGMFLNRGLSTTDRTGLKVGTEHALATVKKYEGIADDPVMRLFSNFYERATVEGAERIGQMADTYINNVRPHMRKAGLGAVLGGAAVLLYNRKRERDRYDIITDRYPANDTTRYAIADQVQMRLDSGQTSAQYMDPLATASIMQNLNETRVNHSSYAWDRNTALYGGVI